MATDSQSHDQHNESSWWQPALGLSIGLIGIAVLFFAGGDVLFGAFFLGLFFVLLFSFLYAETSPKLFERRELEAARRRETMVQEPKGFAKHSFMWIFLGTETLFFTLLIGISLSVRFATGGWTPAEHLNVPLTAVNTFILIGSSYTMAKGLEVISTTGNSKKAGKYLFATVVLGSIFLSIQAFEYFILWNEGFRPDYGYFGATFFVQTGFHGLHVTFGVIIMFFVALKTYRGGYSKNNYDSVELTGYYWHFVDLVWIILFTVVYLI